MGRKLVIHQYNMLDGQTVNMSSSITSNITNVEQLDKVSIHCSWTAGPAGEFKLEARNGGRGAPNTNINTPISDSWFVLDFGTPLTITGADSEVQILLVECPFTDIRLTYTPSSGSASDLKALLTAKVVGA